MPHSPLKPSGAYGNPSDGLSKNQKMTYLDNIIHFSSNDRAKNAKMLFILPARIKLGKSAIKVLSENYFLVYGVLWNVIVFTEMVMIAFT